MDCAILLIWSSPNVDIGLYVLNVLYSTPQWTHHEFELYIYVINILLSII